MAQVKNNTTHFLYGIANVYARYEGTAAKQADLLERQADKDLEEVRRLERENHAKTQELSSTSNSLRYWSYASSIANSVIDITKITMGSLCYAKEETRPAGILLGASGVTSIANRFFNYMGAYGKVSSWFTSSKEMQETIASRLEAGMQYASNALGLAGSFFAYKTGVVSEMVADAVGKASSVCSYGINFGESLTRMHFAHISSAMQYAELGIKQIYQALQKSAKEAERLSHSVGDFTEALKDMVYNLHRI